jgi:hypothetical protein
LIGGVFPGRVVPESRILGTGSKEGWTGYAVQMVAKLAVASEVGI